MTVKEAVKIVSGTKVMVLNREAGEFTEAVNLLLDVAMKRETRREFYQKGYKNGYEDGKQKMKEMIIKLTEAGIVRNRTELTRFLDEVSGITERELHASFHHYIHTDQLSVRGNFLPIRVPGGTVGVITFNEEGSIVDIFIDRNYVIKTYPENINELVKAFIGYKIIIKEVKDHELGRPDTQKTESK